MGENKSSKYGEILLGKFPDSSFFENFISRAVSFSRINTKDEKKDDEKKIRDSFKPFFKEFEERF